MIIRIGKANSINPTINATNNISGRNINTNNTFAKPHVSFIANIAILPKIKIINPTNSNSIIILFLLFLQRITVF